MIQFNKVWGFFARCGWFKSLSVIHNDFFNRPGTTAVHRKRYGSCLSHLRVTKTPRSSDVPEWSLWGLDWRHLGILTVHISTVEPKAFKRTSSVLALMIPQRLPTVGLLIITISLALLIALWNVQTEESTEIGWFSWFFLGFFYLCEILTIPWFSHWGMKLSRSLGYTKFLS